MLPCLYDLLSHHYHIRVVHIAVVPLHILVACGLQLIAYCNINSYPNGLKPFPYSFLQYPSLS